MLYATVRQRKIHVKNPVTVIQNGIGVDKLMLDMDDEWRDMSSIVCVFITKYTNDETKQEEEVTKEVLHTFGEPLLVPWENLQETGSLSVSCTGYVGDEKVMTTMAPDSFWSVVKNGPVTGETPMEATATLYEQVLGAAGAAREAAQTANTAATELRTAKDRGEFDGVTPTVEIGSVAAGSEAQVTNSGTPQAVVLDFVLPRGVPGPKGDVGLTGPQGPKGEKGDPGADGKDGSDAHVTSQNITAALGYTPLNGSGGTSGQFAVSDGNGGITWVSLTNVGEVGA